MKLKTALMISISLIALISNSIHAKNEIPLIYKKNYRCTIETNNGASIYKPSYTEMRVYSVGIQSITQIMARIKINNTTQEANYILPIKTDEITNKSASESLRYILPSLSELNPDDLKVNCNEHESSIN